MQISNITNSIISTLGNPDSRIPLAIKDVINSSGITYFSYDAGGKLEGKDRFIDEFGTEIIWLAGLPFYKTLADKTIYKLRKLNPNIDVRVINSKDHLNFAEKLLNDTPIKDQKKLLIDLKDAKNRLPEFKKLFYAKFGLATILTFISYYALTQYKQKTTEKAITKEFIRKKIQNEYFIKRSQESDKFKEFDNVTFSGIRKKEQPSFKGGLESFMFNPLKNMLLVDAGITTERLTKSRNKHEFMEYAIKEGSLLFLLYVAGKWMKTGFEKLAEKSLKLPIDLDLRFLNSQLLKEAIQKPNLENEIKAFKEFKTPAEIFEYMFDNKDNGTTIINGAKLSDIIGQFKDGRTDPTKYVDIEELKGFVDSLEKFVKTGKKLNKETGLPILEFLQKARNAKIVSIVANLGACCLALGYIVPKIMFQYRKNNAGTKEFHVEKQIIEKLEQSFSGNKI